MANLLTFWVACWRFAAWDILWGSAYGISLAQREAVSDCVFLPREDGRRRGKGDGDGGDEGDRGRTLSIGVFGGSAAIVAVVVVVRV